MSIKVLILSDHTGITAGSIARAQLVQFPRQTFELEEHPFLDSMDKVQQVLHQIEELNAQHHPPLVFSSFVDQTVRSKLKRICKQRLFDIFEAFTPTLENLLGEEASSIAGQLHGINNAGRYTRRIQALDYAMIHDDGSITRNYAKADVILIGVSRSGKTPTCLYLALHNGLAAANYPLVDEDLERPRLPEVLAPHQKKLVALTIAPRQLQRIRHQRRPNSRYASLEQCEWEVHQANALFRRLHLPVIDTSAISIEEIAMHITAEIL